MFRFSEVERSEKFVRGPVSILGLLESADQLDVLTLQERAARQVE